jgi:hypothetical protein
VNLVMAVMMNEPQIREVVFPPALFGNHMMDMQFLTIFQVLVADRADALLPVDELPATQRGHLRLRSSLLPVLL